jgi:hypothetical protein
MGAKQDGTGKAETYRRGQPGREPGKPGGAPQKQKLRAAALAARLHSEGKWEVKAWGRTAAGASWRCLAMGAHPKTPDFSRFWLIFENSEHIDHISHSQN